VFFYPLEVARMDASDLWTVSQLASEFDLTPQALRFYEQKGLLSPRRVGSTRAYDYRDRARLTLVRKFQRLGFTLDDIREYLALYRSGNPNAEQYRDGLAKIRRRLNELENLKRDVEETMQELRALEEEALHRLAHLENRPPSRKER
jgi:DNA-binding transcriptional MerR regulator